MFSQQQLTNCRTKGTEGKRCLWYTQYCTVYKLGQNILDPKETLCLQKGSTVGSVRGEKNSMNETEGSCQFLKSVLGKMWAARQAACFPFQPEPQEEKQVWHLLGCSSPDIYRTSRKQIKMHCNQGSYKKTRKLHGSQPKSFQNSSQSMYLKTIFSYESKFIICSLLHNFYSRNNLYATPGHSYHKGQDWILLFVKFQNKVHFLPGCFWTAWNNTGSVAQ